MKRLTKRFARKKKPETAPPSPAESSRVTDETLEQHRKEVFSKGRRFVYPVHITKHHIVRNSLIIIAIVIVGFLASMGLAIYRYKSESVLVYRISKILPFPAARVNGRFVSYEEYLFLLRSNQTYLTTQADQADDQQIIQDIRQQSFQQAKQNAILKELAERYKVEVSDDEIEEQIALLQSFSGGEKRLSEIVKEFYGINASELRYLIYIQLLEQKLSPHLSLEAKAKAESVQDRLAQGEDFAALAAELSDDEQTAATGGALGVVNAATMELPEELVKAGLGLQVGATDIVAGPTGFHIVKKLADKEEGAAELAHILIGYDDIDALLEGELEEARVSDYIKL